MVGRIYCLAHRLEGVDMNLGRQLVLLFFLCRWLSEAYKTFDCLNDSPINVTEALLDFQVLPHVLAKPSFSLSAFGPETIQSPLPSMVGFYLHVGLQQW